MSKVAFFIALCASCFSTVLSYGNEARLTHTLYIDSETCREFSYDELVDCFRNFCLANPGPGIEYAYQWLKLMKVDHIQLHRALIMVWDEMNMLGNSENSTEVDRRIAIKGKNCLLLFLAFCADEGDGNMLANIYLNPSEDLYVRNNALFAHLLSVNNDEILKVIQSIKKVSNEPTNVKFILYLSINAAACWMTPDKRAFVAEGLKDLAINEESKYLFDVLDSIIKWTDNAYVKSQFRKDLIQHLLDTPFTDSESSSLKNKFVVALNECTNTVSNVKPDVYTPNLYGPFISYDESILGITPQQRQIRKMARVAAFAAVVAVMAAVIVCFASKRRKNR